MDTRRQLDKRYSRRYDVEGNPQWKCFENLEVQQLSNEEDCSILNLSVVVPAYNEEERIEHSLKAIGEYLDSRGYTYEVIVVDDGSTDRTLSICEEIAKQCPRLRIIHYSCNRGKGYAVRTGVLRAKGAEILICDADLATPIEELAGLEKILKAGSDIVIASRPLRESRLERRQPLYREMAGRGFNLVVQALAVPGIHDTQCGFKLMHRDVAMRIFPLCFLNGFSFDFEVLYLARRLGFKITEAPVSWYHMPGSKVRLLRDGVRMVRDLLRMRLHRYPLAECTHDETL